MAVLKLPARITGTYFPLWNGVRITTCSQVYNTINAFHAVPQGTDGTIVFPYSGTLNAADAKTVQDRGQRLVLTVGGSNAGLNIQTRAQSTNYVNSVRNIITSLGNNVSGIAYNNFEAGVGTSATELVWISQQLAATYGPDFTFNAPIHPNIDTHPIDDAIIRALAASGLNFYVDPQYYDSASLISTSYIVSQTTYIINQLGGASQAGKVAMALGASYGGGGSTAASVAAINSIKASFPLFRGVTSWSAQDDGPAGWPAGTAFKAATGSLPAETGTGTPPPAPAPAPTPAPSPAPSPGQDPDPGPTPTPDGGSGPYTIAGGSVSTSAPQPLYTRVVGGYYFGYSGGDIRDFEGHGNHLAYFHLAPRAGTIGPGAFAWPEGLDGNTVFSNARNTYLRSKGIRTGITVGGGGEGFIWTSDTHVANFLASFRPYVAAMGGVDFIDFNNFEGFSQDPAQNATTATAFGNRLADIVIALRNGDTNNPGYGPNFSATMAPAPGGGYSPLDRIIASTMNSRGALTVAFPQYYDDESYLSDTVISDLTAEWITLLGSQSKVGFIASTRNYTAIDPEHNPGPTAANVAASVTTLKANSATSAFRGALYWTLNYDRTQGWLDTTARRADLSPTAISPPVTGGTGSTVTTVAPVMAKSAYNYGQVMTSSVTVTTVGPAVTVQKMIITARPPSGTHAGGPYLDFFNETGSTFPTGTRTFTGTYTFPNGAELGWWRVYATYLDNGGTWHDGPESIILVRSQDPANPDPTPGLPAPVPLFTGTPLSGTVPLKVKFTNTSSNGTTHLWSFGNGVTSTDASPEYTYNAPGTYSIVLTEYNTTSPNGVSLTKTNYVLVSPVVTPPAPPPAPNPPSGTAPTPVPSPVPPPELDLAAYMEMEVSTDGRTFSPPRKASIGAIGDYKRLVRFNRLGAGRTFVMRLVITDPVDVSLTGAAVELAAGKN